MAIRKKLNQSTESRLLLEADAPVALPPAEIDEARVVVQFDNVRPFVPELLATLRAGTSAELVPVLRDGSTFAIHTATRTFWVKLWHSSAERTRIERAQVLSCLPSTRGMQVLIDGAGAAADEEFDDEEYDDDDYAEADEQAAINDTDVDGPGQV